jgi:hypothetical protein
MLRDTTKQAKKRSGVSVAALAATMAITALVSSAPARAEYFCAGAINGVYTAVSDGQWAKTREIYRLGVTVQSKWTIESSCQDFMLCTGNVVTDQGWSSPLECKAGSWTVLREHPEWQRCPDGSTTPGEQRFSFFVDRTDRTRYRGSDRTVAPSGGCGVNLPMTVELPFRLTPVAGP